MMENGIVEADTEEYALFDDKVLSNIDWNSKISNFRDGVSPKNPGENLLLRPLKTSDYDKGFMQLLRQLTQIGDVPKDKFIERLKSMKNSCDTYYIVVIENVLKGEIIGSASLIIEQKFIHSVACRGRIEDVVVSDEYRGKQLGKLLVETLTLLGKSLGCYKMSLECKEENVKFYQSFGYEPDGQLFMVQRYKD